MYEKLAIKAEDLIDQLFPGIDLDTNEARYYDTLNNIAIAVADYRYDHGLTQSDLAKRLGVTQAMVSKYESGDYNISLKAAFELFEKLGLRFSCQIDPPANVNGSVPEEVRFSSVGSQDNQTMTVSETECLTAA